MKILQMLCGAGLTALCFNVAAAIADLPQAAQIESLLANHLLVQNAGSSLLQELANQRNWNSGNYEFNLRAGSAQRNIVSTGQKLTEWDIALERPLRLYNKVGMDADIGAASVARAEYALGDARHEAGRTLLQLWFSWLRETAQSSLWQQQQEILTQQAQMVEKRFKAGDAPRLEWNQALAAAAQAGVSELQAKLRLDLAAHELRNQFPTIVLPANVQAADPQEVGHDFAYWKTGVLEHDHGLGMAEAHSQVQKLLAQRSLADRVPDPTVGVRYSSETGGLEKVAGVYVSVPLSFGLRSALADAALQQAAIAADREAFARRQLEGEIYATHSRAVNGYATWQQAYAAAKAMRNNAELTAKAYSLGENSLSDSLLARRSALEAALTESLARLDANEARYRLLLDAHQLWPLDNRADDHHASHY